MKNFIVIVLLLANLFVGAMPYYNQDNTALTKTEKQLEEVSFSEIFTNCIVKQSQIISPSKLLILSSTKSHSTITSLFNFETTKIVPKTCKYGYQVLFGSFLI